MCPVILGNVISIHALLAESDPLIFNVQPRKTISIHALLAESDTSHPSPSKGTSISIHALLAESDTARRFQSFCQSGFLSTLSLRRATFANFEGFYWWVISIHALLAESDSYSQHVTWPSGYFYPRSPCGERRT